jgi:hypothetical protein
VFFSEEKAEPRPAGTKRLLILRLQKLSGHGRHEGAADNKSLLLLFFRKRRLLLRSI